MSLNSSNGENILKDWYSWVVKIRNTSGHNTPLGYYTDRGPMGLGQYNSLGEYCGPYTAFSVFLILTRLSVAYQAYSVSEPHTDYITWVWPERTGKILEISYDIILRVNLSALCYCSLMVYISKFMLVFTILINAIDPKIVVLENI